MANTPISGFTSGAPAQSTDELVIARSGANFKLTADDLKTLSIGAGSVSIASGKTLTGSNTLTLAGTDGTTMTFPATSATLARTDAGNTFTGAQTFSVGTVNGTGLDVTQTWGATGTYTGLKYNLVTDSGPSNAASLLMDLQVGGASRFYVGKGGVLSATGIAPVTGTTMSLASNMAFTGASTLGFDFNIYTGATSITSARCLMGNAFQAASDRSFSFSSTTVANGTQDTILTRRGTANLRLGAADAAAPVAQTLSVQSVVAGTTNTAGTNLTITGSQGTGTGAGGSIVFQVAPAGSSGTAQNALSTALTIASNRTVIVGAAFTVATLPAAGTQGRRAWVTDATVPTFLGTLTGGGSVVCPVFDNGTAWVSA